MPVCTEDLNKAKSRSHWNIRWCGENKCRTKREHCKLYSKERHTGGLGGQQATFTSCQNAASSNEFFLQWVDGQIMAEKMCIIFTACYTLRGRDAH